ncbi:MAG: SMC-Scp complex subunit ScpB [Nibricoccus sp.]
MAFNLQKVLKALLFSSSQPLSVKDVQAAIERFHDQAKLPIMTESEEPTAPATESPAAAEPASEPAAEEQDAPVSETPAPLATEAAAGVDGTAEVAEVLAEAPVAPEDHELYHDVPSLVTATQIREAMDAIAAEFRASNDVFLLVEGPTGYRLVTHPRFARWIRILRDEPPPVKLSQSAQETLAIIAYRQPVTRTEIEAIRGVSAEAGVNKLLERELVYIVGRADLLVGRFSTVRLTSSSITSGSNRSSSCQLRMFFPRARLTNGCRTRSTRVRRPIKRWGCHWKKARARRPAWKRFRYTKTPWCPLPKRCLRPRPNNLRKPTSLRLKP